MREIADQVDVNSVETETGRNALMKAAFWGHVDATTYLVNDLGVELNAVDVKGDTALMDAARFGHVEVVKILLAGGADKTITNKAGHTAVEIAAEYGKGPVVELLQ